ncbi:MAG: YqaA family protein [Candidatus Melainabacteria bacterium]
MTPLQTMSGRVYDAMARWASTRSAEVTLCVWAFLEAIVWVILPDFLLIPLSMLKPSHARRFWLVAAVASMLGSITLWVLSTHWSATVGQWLFQLPFTPPAMAQRILQTGLDHGVLITLTQPVSGMPAKVWTWTAATQLHWSPVGYLGLLTLARSIRMGLCVAMGAWLGRRVPTFLRQWWLPLLIAGSGGILWFLTASS